MNRPGKFALTDEERGRADDVTHLAAKGEQALDELFSFLDDPSWAVRRAVVAALASIGEAAAPRLCAILNGDRKNETRLAAAVEALVATQGNIDPIVLLLSESPKTAAVCDAVQILGRRLSAPAVPRLTRLAEAEDDNVSLAAIEALGQIGGEAALAALIAAASGGRFLRAFPAIDMLGRLGSSRALKPLLALLDDPQFGFEAARALGRIGEPAAIPSLAALLSNASDATVRAAAVAIGEILDKQLERFGARAPLPPMQGAAAVEAIRRVVRCLERPHLREEEASLVRVLGWIGGDAAATALVDLLTTNGSAATEAAAALGHMGRAAEPQLLLVLGRADSGQRLMLLPLLSHGIAVASSVAECLSDPDPSVRALACDALARIGDTSPVPRLFELLGDADPHVTQCAAAAIQSLGSEDTERLALQASRATDVRVRRSGLRIVAYFGYASAIDVLVEAIGEPNDRIRDAAILGLASVDDPRATDALIATLNQSSAHTRATAMRALGQARAQPRTIEALRAGLQDPDAWVRYFACQGLSRIKDTESADKIAGLMGDPAGQVRVAVIEALAVLRGARSLDALHRAATGKDPDLQRAALLGLGQVKDVSSLPVLREALGSMDPSTRLVAVSAVAGYDLNHVAEDLRGALSDADDSVRSSAVALLAANPDVEGTRILVPYLTEPALQSRLVEALSRPSEGRIPVLIEALKAATFEVASLIVSVLTRTQDPEAARALENAFGSEDVAVRRAIAPALATLRTSSSRALLAGAALHDPDEEVREIGAAAAAR